MSGTKEMLTELMQRNGELISAQATIEQLNAVVKARDIENQALKAQVNALRDGMDDVAAADIQKRSMYFSAINSLLDKTPEQCLAEYRNSAIDECVAKLASR